MLFNGLYGGRVGVVAVGRPGFSRQIQRPAKSAQSGRFYLVPTETQDVSSTAIRKKLAAGVSVASLTGPGVASYIVEKGIDKLFQ